MEIQTIIHIYSKIIKAIIKFTKNLSSNFLNAVSIDSIFDSEIHQKSITVKDFLERIVKFTKIEPNTLLVSLMNIDIFCEINKNFLLNKKNCHL